MPTLHSGSTVYIYSPACYISARRRSIFGKYLNAHLKFTVYGHKQTYTRDLQCSHTSVGLTQARPNYHSKYLKIICNIIHHTVVVLFKYSSKRSNNVLRECRTMWDKRKQAVHYSIDCYAAKSLPMKYLYHSPQAIHAWRVAKTRFVANSTVYTVLNSLE